jgi:hypothetical protein
MKLIWLIIITCIAWVGYIDQRTEVIETQVNNMDFSVEEELKIEKIKFEKKMKEYDLLLNH